MPRSRLQAALRRQSCTVGPERPERAFHRKHERKWLQKGQTYCPLDVWAAFVKENSVGRQQQYCPANRDESLFGGAYDPSDRENMLLRRACGCQVHQETFFAPGCENGPRFLVIRIPDAASSSEELNCRAALPVHPCVVRLNDVEHAYELFAALLHNGAHYCNVIKMDNAERPERPSQWHSFDDKENGGRARRTDGPHVPGYTPAIPVYRHCEIPSEDDLMMF